MATTTPGTRPKLDRALHARQAKLTGGFSPTALTLAYVDWLAHLANSPGKLAELAENAAGKGLDFAAWSARRAGGHTRENFIEPLPQDRRFRGESWQRWPYHALWQGFLLAEQWWHYATTDVPGVSVHHEDMVSFMARQWLDVWAPSNFPWSNPRVMEESLREGGANLIRGARHLAEDVKREWRGEPLPDGGFRVGENLATTPGKYIPPERWLKIAAAHSGSWWPAWKEWLDTRSGDTGDAPAMGAPDAGLPVLCDAPGDYVRMT